MESQSLETWADLAEALALHTPLTISQAINLTSVIRFGNYTVDGGDRELDLPPSALFGPLAVLANPDTTPDHKGAAVRALVDLVRLHDRTPLRSPRSADT